ncbi:flagellar hook-basal body complex protein FliE [Pelomonas sp. CA6]|uniref:flagellar hook-basal body complex protein FliE n=1 Tax=Pelomonas sp. CA6 TaxID=2907999 RepID=UPI001F4BFF84|nr:flagellar hook-basal body complex protein FliE [Pelomonas sp. CA6]MCH7345284.1 flagellar hook-basal body complex protein FliE [Pelomonas sp. CA6]
MTVQMAMGQAALETLLQGDALRLQQEAGRLVAPGSEAAAGMPGFEQVLRRVDERSQLADQRMEAVERGESDDLVGAMLASQEASLSFSMLMQVRNKVVGAVDELIKLQL